MASGFKALVALTLSSAASSVCAQTVSGAAQVSADVTTRIEQPAMIANAPGVMTAFTGASTMVAPSSSASAGSSGPSGAAVLRSVTRTSIAAIPTPTTFVVTGDSGQSISVTVPPSVDLTREGGTETALLTTTSNIDDDGPQFLRGDFAGSGALSFNVGGQVTLASNMAAGTYNGILMVVAQYN
jgi:hypothetical protein